jgi:hypothetical protein
VTQVARKLTPLSREETAARFASAYRAVFGIEPDRNRAELLLALAWVENANGASFICFNWGNLSVKPSESVAYWRPPWFDLAEVEAMPEGAKKARLLDVHTRMLAGTAPEAFRAFDSHEQGLAAWLELLKRRPAILTAASSGDSTAFAHAIYSTKYCPDAECRDAGPAYGRKRDEIRSAGYFAGLRQSAQSSGNGAGVVLALFALGAVGVAGAVSLRRRHVLS